MSEGMGRQPAGPPVVAGGLLGRDVELDRVLALVMRTARLVTLTGPGGIGKTQLAAEAARRYHKATRRPVWWIRLARLAKDADRAAIEEEIARTVVGADSSGRPSWEVLVEALVDAETAPRGSRPLLVLDNCEHVRGAVAAVVGSLLAARPGLIVGATSREALGLAGECEVSVPPLPRRAALELFRGRAELAGRPVADDQLETVSAICEHLHDNPLYIRLAAAQLVRRPLRVVLDELDGADEADQRLRWPRTPRVGAEERHRGIGDAIAWSYDLCGDDERLLFERMSVFAPGSAVRAEDAGATDVNVGVDLAAIEAVCSDDGLARTEIRALLHRLVERSLVSVHTVETSVRYSLLESLQVFARERLRQRPSEVAGDPVGRHLRYYRDRVADVAAHWFGPREAELMRWVRSAWPDVLMAIRASFRTPADTVLGLEICVGLQALPAAYTASLRQARVWTERGLTATAALPEPPERLRIQAAAALVWIALRQGLHDDAEQLLDRCVDACALDPGDRGRWRETARTDIGLPAAVEFVWGCELWLVRQDVAAVAVLTRAREKFRRDGAPGFAARCDLSLMAAAALLDTAERAERLIRECGERAVAAGSQWTAAWGELIEAVLVIGRGDGARASALITRSASYLVAAGDQWGLVWAVVLRVWALARTLADRGDTDRDGRLADATEIARLTGAMRTLRASFGIDIQGPADLAERIARVTDMARDLLGYETFTAAHEEGMRLPLRRDGLQRVALGVSDAHTERRSDRSGEPGATRWTGLSESEQRVAILAAAGWTDKAIAARRATSVRTVHTQMAAILHKLTAPSRRDIVRFLPEERRTEVRAEAARRTRSATNPRRDG